MHRIPLHYLGCMLVYREIHRPLDLGSWSWWMDLMVSDDLR